MRALAVASHPAAAGDSRTAASRAEGGGGGRMPRGGRPSTWRHFWPAGPAWRRTRRPRRRVPRAPAVRLPLLPGQNGPSCQARRVTCLAQAARLCMADAMAAAGRHPRRRAGSGCPLSQHARPSRARPCDGRYALAHSGCCRPCLCDAFRSLRGGMHPRAAAVAAAERRLGTGRPRSCLAPAVPGVDLSP